MFVHRIDPVLADLGGLYLWWYGLGFALGLSHVLLYLKRHRVSLGLSPRATWALALQVAVGVLAGGRLVEVVFDEWFFYRRHPGLVPAFWLGGMASHGVLLGAFLAVWTFSRRHRLPFLRLADALVVPGAVLLGLGRIGNFIDGQIVGSVTSAWWGVQFPDADGFRHPVVLYDGAKNLVLAAFLARVRRTRTTPGAAAARFVFWYAFPRIFIDLFRDYPTHRLALGTGQTLNLVMAAAGAMLLARSRLRRLGRLGTPIPSPPPPGDEPPRRSQRLAWAVLLLLCLTIPSNWTQDVPGRYGKRHPGLAHWWLYPPIDTRPPPARGR